VTSRSQTEVSTCKQEVGMATRGPWGERERSLGSMSERERCSLVYVIVVQGVGLG
jgi:hypothetical protein